MGKVILYKEIESVIKKLKQERKTVVLAGGCFDILHSGHIEFLKKAKALGDVLIILLESDQAVRKLKGKGKPINPQEKRALVLSSTSSVDYVLPIPHFQNDQKYRALVKKIEPDIIAVTSEDPMLSVKTEHAKSVGGKVVEATKRIEKYSSSKIAEQLNDL